MAEKGQASDHYGILKQKLRLTDAKARVTQVVDGETIIVNNAETLHLPMLYIPSLSHGDTTAMTAAKAYLDKHVAGKFITVFQVRNNDRALTNALGHKEAYILMQDGTFVQHDMIEKGLAFAYPSQSHHIVADILYKAEDTARNNEAGLWGQDQWQVLDEKEVKQVNDRFVVVEGRIEKVASRKNVIYLNFDRDWKQDFTVAIASNLRRDFSKANKPVMQLGGKAVRVRGWVRDYNGPYMDVFHPSQIEIIAEPKGERVEEATEVEEKDVNASLFDKWGLDSMLMNDIAPKSPMMGDAAQVNRPYTSETLKPLVPLQPLTGGLPKQARSPAAVVPQGVQDAQKSSYDQMDRGLLNVDAGPGGVGAAQ